MINTKAVAVPGIVVASSVTAVGGDTGLSGVLVPITSTLAMWPVAQTLVRSKISWRRVDRRRVVCVELPAPQASTTGFVRI